jgi:hypothetical protein
MDKKDIKNDLRDLRIEITEAKRVRKAARTDMDMSEAATKVRILKHEYRIKHIVYCLLRWRKYLQIERSVRECNEVSIGTVKAALLNYPDLSFEGIPEENFEGLSKW